MHGFVAVCAIASVGLPPAAAIGERGGAALAGDACQCRTSSLSNGRRRRQTDHPLGWEALAERFMSGCQFLRGKHLNEDFEEGLW